MGSSDDFANDVLSVEMGGEVMQRPCILDGTDVVGSYVENMMTLMGAEGFGVEMLRVEDGLRGYHVVVEDLWGAGSTDRPLIYHLFHVAFVATFISGKDMV